MGLIAELLKEIPAAAKYRQALEAMEQEISRLTAENAALNEELGHFIHRWQTLDGEAVNALVYLSHCERGNALEISQANRVNIQIAETYLAHLAQGDYVETRVNGSTPHYAITRKGRRYLMERGLGKR